MSIFRTAKIIADKESLYSRIVIIEEDGVRYLKFGNHVVQSAEYVDDPMPVRVDYIKYMPLGLIFNPVCENSLFIGLGSGTLQRLFAKRLPLLKMDTVEIDAEVVRMAEKYMHYKNIPSHNLIILDGRTYIKRCSKTYDIVFLDAYNADIIPFHLTTREFLLELKHKLSEKGVVAANLWTLNASLYLSMVRTYESVFNKVYRFPVRERNNSIIIGANIELSKNEIFERTLNLQKTANFPYDLPRCAKQLDTQKLNFAGSKIITDDMAANLWQRKLNGVSLF